MVISIWHHNIYIVLLMLLTQHILNTYFDLHLRVAPCVLKALMLCGFVVCFSSISRHRSSYLCVSFLLFLLPFFAITA